jgi:hypothetical protein
MLSKCANPGCSAKLRYLREGKIYRIETEPARSSVLSGALEATEIRAVEPRPIEGPSASPHTIIQRSTAHRQEYFWLCQSCCEELTVSLQDDAVVVVPVRKPMAFRAAAS